MFLPAGFRLGPYEVLTFLGRGGMGEVYTGRDERLGRIVALKLLPPELAQDARRLLRFEREARAASALNHPNIVTIHEFVSSDGHSYIVMEYVEGKTLRDHMREGPLPVRQMLDVASQVANGLAAAHARGIVHRDLKPENIMLAQSGFVKILDFGLAKEVPSGDGGGEPSSPISTTQTAPHVIVGTLAYMSPEQGKGGDVDFRSDQFSLGVVLYEICTGQHPFRRAESHETIRAIARDEPPPLRELRPDLPAPFRWAVERCLSKDPSGRFDSTADLARDIACLRDNLPELTPMTSNGAARRAQSAGARLVWPMVVLALIALGAAFAYSRWPRLASPVLRFTVSPPAGTTFNFSTAGPAPVAISPDGKELVFGARDSTGKETLWLRSLSDLVPRPLAGTEGATYPFWSPDSRSIAFFAGRELRKISASGGPVEKICDTLQGRGGTWNRKGMVVFAPGEGSLFQVPASGGTPVPLASTAGGGAMDALWPHFLPDGRHFLYVAVPRSTSTEVTIRVGSLDTDQERVVVPAASSVAYAPPGYLLFARGANLVATPFDVNGFRVTGDPVVVAEAVHHHHYRLNADFSMSETGVLAYYGVADRSQLQWFDRRGRALGLLGERAEYGGVRFSPDGSRCAVEIYNPRTSAIDVWLLDLKRGVTTRLTSRAMISDAPIWSPDGERILFSANPSGVWDLYLRASADVGEDELAYTSGLSKTPTDWSRDGRFVAFTQCCDDRAGNVDIWVFSLADRSARPFLRTPFKETAARFSPDGQWIVYVSDEAGRPEVYARSFPTAEGKIRVSAEGGAQPLWALDGSEIFYVSADDKLMAVPVRSASRLSIGEPRALFSLRLTPSATDNPLYAVSADGQRILVNTPGTPEGAGVVVHVNWTALLNR